MYFPLWNLTNIMIRWISSLRKRRRRRREMLMERNLLDRLTCSVKNKVTRSKNWFPSREVKAKYRNKPSKTGIGICLRISRINNDIPMRICERSTVNRVSRTLTILEKFSDWFFSRPKSSLTQIGYDLVRRVLQYQQVLWHVVAIRVTLLDEEITSIISDKIFNRPCIHVNPNKESQPLRIAMTKRSTWKALPFFNLSSDKKNGNQSVDFNQEYSFILICRRINNSTGNILILDRYR